MKCEIIVVNILVTAIILLSLCEARGGRRGGSFGGLFGSWRKYKKPASNGGNSRRIVSSSPVHTPITKAWHENKKPSNSDKFNKNFRANNNMTPLPTGGSYYQNTAALPGNAIYVERAPPRGAEFGDFLTGYLTGRLLTMGFSTPHHVTHIYRENPTNSGQPDATRNVSNATAASQQEAQSTERVFSAPLIDFSTTTAAFSSDEAGSSTTQLPLSNNATEPYIPPFGIICVPILINETNAEGAEVQTERTVCYPAPAPPAPQEDMKSKPVEIAGDIVEH